MFIKQINSVKNPLIKELLVLNEKSRARKASGSFIIEGRREVNLAIKGGYKLESILFCPDLVTLDEIGNISNLKTNLIEISMEVYQKIAYRTSTEGIIAVANTKDTSLAELVLQSDNA